MDELNFLNSKITNIELFNNKKVNNVYLYTSRIENISGDINNLKGITLSLEQILDKINKIGIKLQE